MERTELSQAAAEPGYDICSVCGEWSWFEQQHRSIREGFPCEHCAATLRYRHQARVIVHEFSLHDSDSLKELVTEPEFVLLRLYEPGIIGPFRKLFRATPRYVQSYYWPDVAPGSSHEGVRCENLQALTFEDHSIDLVITSDIFEHIRDPWLAFEELHRVLVPGGKHIFTVPMTWPPQRETTPRVDVSTREDEPLLPPRYHSSPTDPRGSLVYNDFGLDIIDRLAEIGFETDLYHGLQYNLTFCATKP